MKTLLLITSLVLATTGILRSDVNPLEIARSLANEDYKDYTYGSSGDRKVDCTQFVSAVVLELADQCNIKIPEADRRTLGVVLSAEEGENLQTLVDKSDKRIRGVQQAIISAGFGIEVEADDAKPGDLVQYWYKTATGTWAGHAGLIEKIEDGKATIYGSHKTTLQREHQLDGAKRKGGIGSGPVFDLGDETRKVFVVRWTKPRP
jgi:hypothetical protein